MKSNYQNLFDYFSNEHNLTLTESEMSDIITEVRKIDRVTTCPDCLDGRDEFEPNWECPDCRNSIPPFTP